MTIHLEKRIAARRSVGNLRHLPQDQQLIDFSSNDTLGLARSQKLHAAVLQELDSHPHLLHRWGSTGSRLLTGNSRYCEELEEKIAHFHGHEAGLLFNCGYMANIGLLSTIGDSGDVIFYDAQVHASVHDGIRLSRASVYPFKHNDCHHLQERLRSCRCRGARYICVESIYSTDGSVAPLRDICQLAKIYNAKVIVDEAHATGAWGPEGRGLVAHHNLTTDIFAHVVTFGKALGTHGAIILGSSLLKELLVNFATSFIYTTSLPFALMAAIKCSYDRFPAMEAERQQLRKLIRIFRESYSNASETHIQPIFLKGNTSVKEAAKHLMNVGFDVRALTSPTVRRGKEMLRLCLHAFNTEAELSSLITSLQKEIIQ